jgi:hypothetical protein
MRFACCIPTTTNTHSEYAIHVLTAFPFQQWLHECASMLTFIRTSPDLCKYTIVQRFRNVRDTAVGIATRYGLDGPGFETQWGGRDICMRPHRPRGPPNLMYNGYRVSFSGVKQPGSGVNHPLTAPRSSMGSATSPPPFCDCLECYGTASSF